MVCGSYWWGYHFNWHFFTTPSISATTTYYVASTSGSCTTSPRIAVTATVNTPPTATAANNGPVCTGSALSLTGGPGSMSNLCMERT